MTVSPGREVEQLLAETRRMGVRLDTHQAEQLLAYLDLLQKWNGAYNLTAIRERAAMRVQHLLDSLSILPWVHPQGRLLDMGTGAGLPGIPLAVALPKTRWWLVDSVGKKVRFLRQVRRELGLNNVEPVQARLEEMVPETPFDQITARALADLNLLMRLARPLLEPGGELLAMKARRDVEREDIDCERHGFALCGRHELQVPGLEASRSLLQLQRCRKAGEKR